MHSFTYILDSVYITQSQLPASIVLNKHRTRKSNAIHSLHSVHLKSVQKETCQGQTEA